MVFKKMNLMDVNFHSVQLRPFYSKGGTYSIVIGPVLKLRGRQHGAYYLFCTKVTMSVL